MEEDWAGGRTFRDLMIACSVTVSSAAVASSQIRSRGFLHASNSDDTELTSDVEPGRLYQAC